MADAKIVLSAEDRASRVLKGLRKEMQETKKSTAGLRGEMQEMKKGAASLNRVLGNLGVGLSVAAVVGFAKSILNGLDSLNDLADVTGDTVENLSALEDIAARTGTSMDTASDAVIKLNKALYDARKDKDSAAGQAIKNLGLNIDDLLKLSPVERLQAVGKALNSFDGDNKLEYNLTLLGKSARTLAPLLKDLAEAGALSGTGTTQAALAAEELNKELFALNKSATDIARTLGVPVIKALTQVLGAFSESGRALGELTGTAAAAAVPFQTLAVLGAETAFVFRGVGTEIGGIAAQIAALGRGDFAGFSAIGLAMKEDAAAARKDVDALVRRIMNIDGAANDALRRQEDRGFIPRLGRKLPPIINGNSNSGKKDKVGEAEIFDPEERFRASERAAQAATEEALRIARLTDVERDRAEALKLVADNQQRLDDLLGATPTAKLEEARADMLLLADAFERGAITAEQFNEAASARLGNVAAEAEKAADAWSVFADEAARNIQDALGDTLQATMEGNWRSIGDSWKRMLDRMVAEALGAKIGQALLGDFGKSGNLGGLAGDAVGLFTKLFAGSAKGNAFGPGGMLAFASGGIVNGATPFAFGGGRLGVMGEAGPEAIVPLKRGRDGTLGVGGGIVVNQTINLSTSGPTDRRSIAQLQTAVGLATQRAIARNT